MTNVSLRLPLAILDAVIETHDIKLKSERTEEMNILIRSANLARMASNGNALEAYANKALDNMVSELSSMSQGGRNNTAFKFGASIGNMIAAGMISHGIAEPLLISAAMASGLSQYEARTVTRGIERGMQTPFDTSKLSQKNDNKYWLDRDTYKDYIESLPSEEPTDPKIELADDELLPAGYKSWVGTQYLPLVWIRAFLTLADSRSAVATTFIKLHEALRIGELDPTSFTMKEVCKVLDTPRGSTTAAIDTLSEWGFVRDNESYSIYTSMPNKPIQNLKGGRPAKTYSINTDTEMLNLELAERLDYFVIEQHTNKSIAPRLYTMIQDLDLSNEDAKQWQKRNELLLDSDVMYKIDRDRKAWKEKLLGKAWSETIAYDSQYNNTELRSRILINHIKKHENGVQMSQDEMMALLGLKSVNSFKTIYQMSKIKPQKMVEWSVINAPNDCDLKQEIINAGKPTFDRRGGVVIALNLKVFGGKWLKYLSYGDKMFETYKTHDGMIDDMQLRVQLPCLIRFKTEQEIADEIKLEKLAAIEAANELALETDSDVIETQPKEPAKVASKPRYSTRKDRSWNSHDKTWVHEQLRAEMYCWLNQDLNDSSLSGASKIIQYINTQCTLHQIDKPVHSLEDYYSSDVLDFSIDEPIAKDEDVKMFKKVTNAIISAVQKKDPIEVKKVIVKKRHMTLAETRAWGKAEDKVAYKQSIGIQ